MFNIFNKKKKNAEISTDNLNKEDKEKDFITTTVGISTTNKSISYNEEISKTFSKPYEYTGNRNLYDSAEAKRNAKINVFSNQLEVKDPNTNSTLVNTKLEAKATYGDDWQKHLAEADHITPIKKVFNKTKNNPWLTNDDIKNIANREENIQIVSRKFNNAKRSRTNKQFVTDDDYLEKLGIELSQQGKKNAISAEKRSEIVINRDIKATAFKNVMKTGHDAGKYAASNAATLSGTISAINNITAVIKGEKEVEAAIKDITVDTSKAVITGYSMGGGLNVISQSLSNSSSGFLRALSKSNIPGNIITSVAVTGDTIIKYMNNEISTEECILQLGEKGLNIATAGYSMAAGQALIPIPVIGAAVGALVGSVLTNGIYRNLISDLNIKKLEQQERERIIRECEILIEEEKRQREEFRRYIEEYFSEYKQCFSEALFSIKEGFDRGDPDSIILGANKITNKLGGKVNYNSVEEFKEFLVSDLTDIL